MTESNKPVSIAHDLLGVAGLSKWAESITTALFGGGARLYNDVTSDAAAKDQAYRTRVEGRATIDMEAYRIERLAEAEAYKSSIEARARTEARETELKAQRNLEGVAKFAALQAPEECIDPQEVDPDWIDDFKDIARRTNKADLQELLAKILVGEMQKPGTYPVNVAINLRSLSPNTLILFQKFVNLRVLDKVIVRTMNFSTETKYGIKFDDLVQCWQADLLDSERNANVSPINSQILEFIYGGEKFKLTGEKSLNVPVYMFTPLGRSIADLMEPSTSDEYKQDMEELFKSSGFVVTRSPC